MILFEWLPWLRWPSPFLSPQMASLIILLYWSILVRLAMQQYIQP